MNFVFLHFDPGLVRSTSVPSSIHVLSIAFFVFNLLCIASLYMKGWKTRSLFSIKYVCKICTTKSLLYFKIIIYYTRFSTHFCTKRDRAEQKLSSDQVSPCKLVAKESWAYIESPLRDVHLLFVRRDKYLLFGSVLESPEISSAWTTATTIIKSPKPLYTFESTFDRCKRLFRRRGGFRKAEHRYFNALYCATGAYSRRFFSPAKLPVRHGDFLRSLVRLQRLLKRIGTAIAAFAIFFSSAKDFAAHRAIRRLGACSIDRLRKEQRRRSANGKHGENAFLALGLRLDQIPSVAAETSGFAEKIARPPRGNASPRFDRTGSVLDRGRAERAGPREVERDRFLSPFRELDIRDIDVFEFFVDI